MKWLEDEREAFRFLIIVIIVTTETKIIGGEI